MAQLEVRWSAASDSARVELGRELLRCAADVQVGAAERALCALACVALGSADPASGLLLQPGLGNLRLLEIVEQIPVAAQIRQLLLEFRHTPLDREVPATFLARVEDLLERFDGERLTAVRLGDRREEEEEEEEEGRGKGKGRGKGRGEEGKKGKKNNTGAGTGTGTGTGTQKKSGKKKTTGTGSGTGTGTGTQKKSGKKKTTGSGSGTGTQKKSGKKKKKKKKLGKKLS